MTISEPRPPVDIFRDAVPTPMIQRRGDRQRGWDAWEAWVQYGPMRYRHQRLLRSFHRIND